MDEARPERDGDVKTDMEASLESILGSHLRAHRDGNVMKRGLTLLVLTDGLWKANDEDDVEEYLVTFIKTNKADWGWTGDGPDFMSQRRPVSIQFIRFGHDPNAIARLKRLDDDIKDRPGLVGKLIP